MQQITQESRCKLHWMWNETRHRLDTLQGRVNEGRDLNAGAEFARYILWSGIIKIFEEFACDGPLKVDGSLIRWKATELERSCTEHFRIRGQDFAHIESLHEKLDLLAGYVARLGLP